MDLSTLPGVPVLIGMSWVLVAGILTAGMAASLAPCTWPRWGLAWPY